MIRWTKLFLNKHKFIFFLLQTTSFLMLPKMLTCFLTVWPFLVILRLPSLFYVLSWYSVMQSVGNSWKIDIFRWAITSELMIVS